MRFPRHTFVLLAFSCFFARAQETCRVDSFYAPSLSRMAHYSLLLPASYKATDNSFPVLYLLHGYTGGHSNWIDKTGLTSYVRDLDVIVVMPDAENSWYVNSYSKKKDRFEEFIVSDLKNHIERTFRVDTTKRAVAGLSMGGYGAIILAFRHPALFRFAGSLSGALSIPGEVDFSPQARAERGLTNIREVFGPPGPQRTAFSPANIFRNVPASSLPYTYLAIGTKDGFTTFLPAHRALIDSLRSYGARYEYHETPGGHNWQYWDREIQPLLTRMMDIFNEPRP